MRPRSAVPNRHLCQPRRFPTSGLSTPSRSPAPSSDDSAFLWSPPSDLSFGSSSVLTALSASCFLFRSRFPYSPCFLFRSRFPYSPCFLFRSRVLYSLCFSRLTLNFSRVQPVSSLSRLPRFLAQSPLPRALYVCSSSALPQLRSSAPSLRISTPLSCVLAFPLRISAPLSSASALSLRILASLSCVLAFPRHISAPLSGASALPLHISARRPASSLLLLLRFTASSVFRAFTLRTSLDASFSLCAVPLRPASPFTSQRSFPRCAFTHRQAP